MSAASRYGAAIVAGNFDDLNAIFGNTFEANEPETAAGDVIAYLLHWVEAKYVEYNDPDRHPVAMAETALAKGREYWEVERGEGDDIANDPSYDDLLARLETT